MLGGYIGGARAVVRHRDDLGPSFELTKLVYVLDGKRVLYDDDEPRLKARKHFDVLDRSVQPGEHTLSVHLVLRGHGYALFPYFRGGVAST